MGIDCDPGVPVRSAYCTFQPLGSLNALWAEDGFAHQNRSPTPAFMSATDLSKDAFLDQDSLIKLPLKAYPATWTSSVIGLCQHDCWCSGFGRGLGGADVRHDRCCGASTCARIHTCNAKTPQLSLGGSRLPPSRAELGIRATVAVNWLPSSGVFTSGDRGNRCGNPSSAAYGSGGTLPNHDPNHACGGHGDDHDRGADDGRPE